MKNTTALFACFFTLALLPGSLSAADAYLVRNLVSDIPGLADQTDPHLVGSWGISESGGSPFWISDAGAGVATLYNSTGGIIPLVVTIPPSKAGGAQGVPTGTVFSGASGFTLASGKSALFIFDTLDGTVSGWTSGTTSAAIQVDNSSSGASYTGLALAGTTSTSFLYAANFHAGTIDVFDTKFAPVKMANAFHDPMIPAGFAPFNIQNLGGKLYVAYAMQNANKSFAASGAGLGYIDVFDTSGNLMQRLISQGHLNTPWGLALAPAGFGDFAGDLLVGNFGDGTVNVFNPATGAFIAQLNDVIGAPIVVPGLWALQPGNGGSGGDKNAVYFTAGIPGPDGGNHGLFGRLQSAPALASSNVVLNGASFQPGVAPNTWIEIQGANLASTTRTWQTSDFVGTALPTELDGAGVTIGGKPAYVYYISPHQLNVLVPAGTPVGPAQVQTFNEGLASGSTTIQVQAVAPAFFLAADGKHVVATHADGSFVGPAGQTPSVGTPAKPGETIVLYGTGFGQTTPAIPDGMVVGTISPLTTPPVIMVGGATADVPFAGLVSAGLYQFNVTIPAATPDGDATVTAQTGGQTSPTELIPVQH